ncbi:MAG: tetratricopeptide repeat protein [Verrucomicrobia bacterium]|nr:tetratricopeptide repeat protein [Verrucomicrobiota bacterium]
MRALAQSLRPFLAAVAASLALAGLARAADLAEADKKFRTGQYQDCLRLATRAVKSDDADEGWHLLLLRAQLATGQYTNAFAALTNALERYPMNSSIQLRLLGRDVFLANGEEDRAKDMLAEINQLASSRTWAFRDATNRIIIGRAALLLGADPKLVLEKVYDPAKKTDPACREVHLAAGELALDKQDFALAARSFQDGLKKFTNDVDFLFGLAKSHALGDRGQMLEILDAALNQNSNHAPSLLLLADYQVDAEDYAEAAETLARIDAVNPAHPEAWAYRAVLAHLKSDADAEHKARATALKFWKKNPAVDHLIGRKLSQKYRFAEGAACQRRALRFDESFTPAKAQLAQDLLRLGEETEGWELAEAVNKEDGYDVGAYNLVTLKDTMDKFQTLTNEHFILRMSAREAGIYGQEVLALLERARATLTEKYGFQLTTPTTVEIFPEQKDFAVRTFGMPGGIGYLGVCFGHVITANSPASQAAHPVNWQAVLWHEFCHVITLQMTRNKMPRWLSEGISVFEEIQANPAWGQAMTPRYREMILGESLTPIRELSAAFLAPKSDEHLQFAYYESSLVVEFIVEKFGLDSLKKILADLAAGTEINRAIAAHTAPMARLETDFAAFARARAEQLAPGLAWNKPRREDAAAGPEALAEWAAKNPTNYYALGQRASRFIKEKKWDEAKAALNKLVELFPADTSAGNARARLAEIHRELNEADAERAVLAELAARDPDAADAFLRLAELGAARRDWPAVVLNAERHLAVNPLFAEPHRHLARAREELRETPSAIAAYRTVLQLDPPDPAEVHFRLAKLLQAGGDASAKRHALQALEEAPRFREAHRLLLQINSETNQNPAVHETNPPKP